MELVAPQLADVDWAAVSSRLVSKLNKPRVLQRAIETPVKQRTALDAANVALARLINDGFCT